MTDEERNLLPKEEVMDKLREAVFKTKGLCNNDDALRIARHKDSTVEDVIRLGSYAKIEPRAYYRPLGGSPRSRFRNWATRIDEGRKVMLKDTVIWRYLKSKGLDEYATQLHLDRCHTKMVMPARDGYKSDSCQQLQALMMFSKIDDCEVIISRPRLMEAFQKIEHSPCPENQMGKPAYEDYYNGREEFYQAELDWMTHAPQEILERFEEGERATSYASMTQCMWNMSGSINNGNPNDMTAFKAREYARQMTQFMKYMGLGVAGIGGYSWGVVRNRKNTQALAKYMMTVKNKFDQMIKKGFETSIVREEIISMLNNWCATKCIIGWTFFARTDAPTEYPDLEKQKKVHKLHRSGSVSPTVVTVSDDEAKVVKLADGTELKFNRKVAQ